MPLQFLKEKKSGSAFLNSQSGFALVIVIMVMLLITFLASQLTLQVRTELAIASTLKKRAAADFLAEAGVNLAVFRMLDSAEAFEGEGKGTLVQGVAYEENVGSGTVRYLATNESGKMDLNHLPTSLFELFLQYHGIEQDQIQVILDSLQDWRDTDDLVRLNGAEKQTYEGLPSPYIPRNGDFEEPGEFFLVYGTAALIGRFAANEIFTVNNQQGKINCNSLTPAMLDFFTEGDAEKKQAYLEALNVYGELNDALLQQVLGDERFSQLQGNVVYGPGSNHFFSITAYGLPMQSGDTEPKNAAKGQTCRTDVLVNLVGDSYRFISWKERFL